MNQPKFKFGDKVIIKATGKVFVIDHMRHVFDEVQYWRGSADASRVYEASELEPYQEPQKKKLYAYSTIGGEVVFSKDEGLIPDNGFGREAEYDIEYPENTLK